MNHEHHSRNDRAKMPHPFRRTVDRREIDKARIAQHYADQLRIAELDRILVRLLDATEDTLRSHPETNCCFVTRKACEDARAILNKEPS
jgi:hypothetical protein